jgi:hypothetical protein
MEVGKKFCDAKDADDIVNDNSNSGTTQLT